MLKEEVLTAVKQGLFSIWAIDTVDDGLEILTGLTAGKRLQGGSFSKNSVHCKVDERLRELNRNVLPVAPASNEENSYAL